MKIALGVLKWLWWLAAACIPVAQHSFYRRYAGAIGCPLSGDCYVPGSEHLLYLELLELGAALVLWPACAWFLIVKPLANRLRSKEAPVSRDGVVP